MNNHITFMLILKNIKGNDTWNLRESQKKNQQRNPICTSGKIQLCKSNQSRKVYRCVVLLFENMSHKTPVKLNSKKGNVV